MKVGSVDIWTARLDLSDVELPVCLSLLSSEEKQRTNRYRSFTDARRFAISRAFLRSVLAGYVEQSPGALRFEYSEYGKPLLHERAGFEFNLSHAGELAVLAVTTVAPIGVDVELVRTIPDLLPIANSLFSSIEYDEIESKCANCRLRAFLNCWTRKEAIVKALGEGLSIPLNLFSVSVECERPRVLSAVAPIGMNWTLWNLNCPDSHVGAIAIAGPPCPLTQHSWQGPSHE